MTMEKQPFEDAFPIKKTGIFQLAMGIFQLAVRTEARSMHSSRSQRSRVTVEDAER